MKKIPTLYKRNRETGLVYDELTDPAFDTVGRGAAQPTVKVDGTCCRIKDGILWKRFDRKPSRDFANKARTTGHTWTFYHAKTAPEGWRRCQNQPDPKSGHWPGWLPVDGQEPADKWHMEALREGPFEDGTYELIGPKVQGNPYQTAVHELVRHGEKLLTEELLYIGLLPAQGNLFNDLHAYLQAAGIEGIVWWVDGAPWVKIKASDFGHEWRSK